MKKLLRIIRNNNLFVKMFLVMVISIVAVSLLITFSTLRMSSNLFMNTFSITNTQVLNQIKEEFEEYSYSIVATSIEAQNSGTVKRVLTQEDTNNIETFHSFYAIEDQLQQIYSANLNEANMILLGENGRLFNMKYSKWPVSAEALRDHPITHNTRQQPNSILYQYVSGDITNGSPMIVATKALTERSSNIIYGYLYFSIYEEELRKFYEGYTSRGNNVLVLNGNGDIISATEQDRIGEKAPDLLALSREIESENVEYKDVNIFDEDYMLLSSSLPTLDLYLVNLVNKDLVIDNLIDTSEVVLISIAIVLIAVLIVFLISRRMTNSLSRLVSQISNMAKYDFSKPVEETGGYEAREIAHSFNYMLNELQEHVEELLRTQHKQRKAELEALQHQINPHFLYNTLASVKFLIKEGKKEAAFETIDALIPLLQNALSDIDETITVEQEITNTKNYVLINQTRYGNRIRVNTFISPDCLHYHLPKLVLQPFIENAFFHAFTEKKHGFIQIMVARKNDKLICEIIDTGDGMQTDKMESHKGKRQLFSGIGVRNVHERIQLLFGEEYGVDISSELKKGTKVKVTLPLLDEKYKNNPISKDTTIKRFLDEGNF